MKRNDYRHGTKNLTDKELEQKIEFHLKYLDNDFDDTGGTTHLNKLTYYQEELEKRNSTK